MKTNLVILPILLLIITQIQSKPINSKFKKNPIGLPDLFEGDIILEDDVNKIFISIMSLRKFFRRFFS
jgi:hypothetical protein